MKELQASYNAKLPGLHVEQYEYGYWVGYDEAEWIGCEDPKPSSKDVVVPTRSVDIAEPISARLEGSLRGRIL